MKQTQKRHHGQNRPQKFNHRNGPIKTKSLAAQKNHLQQNIDKYTAMARDALSSSDKILAERYYQFAEHYLRTLNIIREEEEAENQKEAQRQAARAQKQREEQEALEVDNAEAKQDRANRADHQETSDDTRSHSKSPARSKELTKDSDQALEISDTSQESLDVSQTKAPKRRRKAPAKKEKSVQDSADESENKTDTPVLEKDAAVDEEKEGEGAPSN